MKQNKKWIIKWGLLGLKLKEFDPKDADAALEKIRTIFGKTEVNRIFGASPYVFDIDMGESFEDKLSIRTDGILQAFDPILLSIKIPKKEITVFSFLQEDDVDIGTDFKVIYDGYFYLIWWEGDPNKKIHLGGPEVRDLIIDIINKSDIFEAIPIPPTPFREEYLFAFDWDEKYTDVHIDKIQNNNVYVNLPSYLGIDMFFSKLYMDMRKEFFWYFITLNDVKNLEELRYKMDETGILSRVYLLQTL